MKKIILILFLIIPLVVAQEEYYFTEDTEDDYIFSEDNVNEEDLAYDETFDSEESLEGPSYSQEDGLVGEGSADEQLYQSECPEGCFYNEKCYSIGKQFLTKEYGTEVYCSADWKIVDAKAISSVCQQDYECLSYYCKDGLCQETSMKTARKIGFLNILMGVLAIILVVIIIYAAKNLRLRIKKEPEEEIKK
ncbi:MAG: hypothetical protein PHG05_03335 [Candidatus Nanoarchaeia archaeon]|nr:hypothetical protein [Candidatus Nanoarchaeia archaeon]